MSAAADSPGWRPSLRMQKLYADHSHCAPALGVERALHYTEYYKKLAPRQASALRQSAESLAHHLDRRSIRNHDDESIVGTHTEHRIGTICHIEKAARLMQVQASFRERGIALLNPA